MTEHKIRHRMDFANLCNSLGIADAVEIGTHQAFFASEFMSSFFGTIVLIDPWEGESDQEDGKFYPQFFESTETRDDDMQIAIDAMSRFGDRCVFLRSTGRDSLEHFSDGSVGFVYIDGLHDYESVRSDISDWWPKVAAGGILAGHDYQADCHYDVVRAVNEHVVNCRLPLGVTRDYPASWWIRKPETITG